MIRPTILVFDTETTGIPLHDKPVVSPEQPWIVQLAAILVDHTGKVRGELNMLVDIPDKVEIPAACVRIHGITKEHTSRYGVRHDSAMAAFMGLARHADELVAHNLKFDFAMLQTAFAHIQAFEVLDGLDVGEWDQFCTMEKMRPILAIPPTERMKAAGRTEFKPPSLAESLRYATGETLDGNAHDAMYDARACLDIYNWLWRNNVTEFVDAEQAELAK